MPKGGVQSAAEEVPLPAEREPAAEAIPAIQPLPEEAMSAGDEASSGEFPDPGVSEVGSVFAAEPGAEGRGRVIAIANQKGGVGKSTTAVNLGACLAEAGRRILVIDLDPQGNASTGLGIDHSTRKASAYEVLIANLKIQEAILPTSVEGLWAVPSTIDLAGAEVELVTQFNRESRLARALDGVRGAFDFILLDCPPSLGLLTVNALTAADELIVPIQCEYYALEGLGQLLKNVRLVQQNVNPSLRLTGIVMTMFDGRTKLAEQVVEEVRSYFGPRVYESVIPRSIRLAEAPGFGQPITRYDPSSRGAKAYQALAQELLTRPAGDGLDDQALERLSQGPPLVVTAERTPEPTPERAPEVTAERKVEPIEPTPAGAAEGIERIQEALPTKARSRGRARVESADGPPRARVEGATKPRVTKADIAARKSRGASAKADIASANEQARDAAPAVDGDSPLEDHRDRADAAIREPIEAIASPSDEEGTAEDEQTQPRRRRRWPFGKGGQP
jgi:chromosome partitioning protein